MSASESPKHCAAVTDEQVVPEDIVQILEEHGRKRSALITILGGIQARYRYLPEDALRIVAEQTGVSLVDVYAAATFYHSFSLKPKGKHIVQCCLGTACHVRGGAGIAEELQRQLGIAPGETTPDREFSLETVNCLGACALGPVVVVDGRYFSKVTKSAVRRIVEDTVAVPDRAETAGDTRNFPIEASCPGCGHSLLDGGLAVDGRPSIGLSFVLDGSRGHAALSSLYGSQSHSVEPDIPEHSVVQFFCPHCEDSLTGSWQCWTCGAPLATLNVRGGGQVHICLRRGCQGRLLDLDQPCASQNGMK